MRTVHGTYRRKAKIPKESIAEIDNPEVNVTPKIYGANPAVLSKNIEYATLEPALSVNIQQKKKLSSNPRPNKSENLFLVDNVPVVKEEFLGPIKSDPQLDTETIKEELGLSAGITLQKIVKSANKPPPKLTYHGPNRNDALTIQSFSSGNQIKATQEVNNLKTESETPKMIKITGKFAKKKMPELLPIRKVNGQPKSSN